VESRTKYAIALLALTLLVLGLRLLVSFQVEQPSYESYYALLQADSIRETGRMRSADPFSFGGRDYVSLPLFYYVLALFSLLVPKLFVLKILPNVFMAALVPLVYLLAHNLTKSRWASLAAAFFAGFSPVLFTSYLNSALPLSLALPMAAGLLLALLDLERHPGRALLLTTLLTLLSPVVWLMVAMYLAYLLILMTERIRISSAVIEVALFTFLLAAWYTLITFKEVLYRYGFAMLNGALPIGVRQATFTEFTFVAAFYAIGIVPLVLGTFAIYYTAFEVRSKSVFLIAAFGLVTLLAAALRLLPLRSALLLMSLAFVILSAPGFHFLLSYFNKTRIFAAASWLITALLILFVLSSLLPAIAAGIYPQSSPSPNEFEALDWLRTNTRSASVILAAPKSGFLINYETGRAYVADEDYLLIANPDRVLADIDTAYTTPSSVAAVEALERYGVTHIMVGPSENARYKAFGAIVKDPACFPLLHQNAQVFIYGVNCTREVPV
jgi:hypothetical protein